MTFKQSIMVGISLLPAGILFGATYSDCSARQRHEDERNKADLDCIARGGTPAKWGTCYVKCESEKR
jgi:hypothetical protein